MAFVHMSDVLLDQRRHLPSVSSVLNSSALASESLQGNAYEWQQNHVCPNRFGRLAAPEIQSDCGTAEGTLPIGQNQHPRASSCHLNAGISSSTLDHDYASRVDNDVRSRVDPKRPAVPTSHATIPVAKVEKRRRARTKISASAKAHLKSWFDEKPYPDTGDIAQLAMMLDLTPKAVQTWFYNHRTRSISHTEARNSASEPMSLPSIHVRFAETKHNLHLGNTQSDAQALPLLLERYLEMPYEQDPGMMALFSSDPCLTSDSHLRLLDRGPDAVFSHNHQTPSSPASVQSSDVSSTSISSCGSAYSVSSKPRRRGRRRYVLRSPVTDQLQPMSGKATASLHPLSASSPGGREDDVLTTLLRDGSRNEQTNQGSHELQTASNQARYMISSRATQGIVGVSFRCTFCGKVFSDRYGWERHEDSVHVASTVYVCNEDILQETAESLDLQGFFELLSNSLVCQSRPLAYRVFSRKDHFHQHLIKYHLKHVSCTPAATEKLSTLITGCSRAGPRIPAQHQTLRCGFCGLLFSSFKQRSKHVADHFARRTHFSEWWIGRRPPQNAVLRTVWSCAHLGGPMDAYRLTDSQRVLCLYCRMEFEDTDDWAERIRHLHYQHKYRSCNQQVARNIPEMAAHLQAEHHAGPLISKAQQWFLGKFTPGRQRFSSDSSLRSRGRR